MGRSVSHRSSRICCHRYLPEGRSAALGSAIGEPGQSGIALHLRVNPLPAVMPQVLKLKAAVPITVPVDVLLPSAMTING
jgi:hypothetical protein